MITSFKTRTLCQMHRKEKQLNQKDNTGAVAEPEF